MCVCVCITHQTSFFLFYARRKKTCWKITLETCNFCNACLYVCVYVCLYRNIRVYFVRPISGGGGGGGKIELRVGLKRRRGNGVRNIFVSSKYSSTKEIQSKRARVNGHFSISPGVLVFDFRTRVNGNVRCVSPSGGTARLRFDGFPTEMQSAKCRPCVLHTTPFQRSSTSEHVVFQIFFEKRAGTRNNIVARTFSPPRTPPIPPTRYICIRLRAPNDNM